MSNVTNAAEAIKKLNTLTGGIKFWLSNIESGLITNLTGQVPKASAINIAGPIMVAEAEYSYPYEVPSGSKFGLTVKLGSGDYIAFSATAKAEGEMGSSLLSRLLSEIQKEFGSKVGTSSLEGATIASTRVLIFSNTGEDIILTNATAS